MNEELNKEIPAYREYPNCTKTYVVQRITGNGVMEDPYIDREVVYETDDREEAKTRAKDLKYQNNTSEEIISTWMSNRYSVNVNTVTEEGKRLKAEYDVAFEKVFQAAQNKAEDALKNGTAKKYEHGGITFIVHDHLFFSRKI